MNNAEFACRLHVSVKLARGTTHQTRPDFFSPLQSQSLHPAERDLVDIKRGLSTSQHHCKTNIIKRFN